LTDIPENENNLEEALKVKKKGICLYFSYHCYIVWIVVYKILLVGKAIFFHTKTGRVVKMCRSVVSSCGHFIVLAYLKIWLSSYIEQLQNGINRVSCTVPVIDFSSGPWPVKIDSDQW